MSVHWYKYPLSRITFKNLLLISTFVKSIEVSGDIEVSESESTAVREDEDECRELVSEIQK